MIFIYAATLTILTETLFWSCFKTYRKPAFLIWNGLVNLFSNVNLNMVLLTIMRPGDGLLSIKVLIGECLVVVVEFLLLCCVCSEKRFQLFYLTLIANIITYSMSFFI